MQLIKTVLAAEPLKEVCTTDAHGTTICAAPLSGLETIFGNVVVVILGLAGLILFIMLIIGGLKYITSAGDPKKVESARNTLTFAIGGLILIALAYLILRFIEEFTGVSVENFKIIGP